MTTPRHDIPIPLPKPKAKPGQIKPYDNRDDRIEIGRLLVHLPPYRRVAFLAWACSQAILPGSWIHPVVGITTKELAEKAMKCDRADGALTMDVLLSITHMAIDYSLDLSACLARLVLMARGRDEVATPTRAFSFGMQVDPDRLARLANGSVPIGGIPVRPKG